MARQGRLVSIEVDTRGLDDAFVALQPKAAKKAVAKALTRTAKSGRTKAARIIGREFSIRSTEVKKSLSARRASREQLSAGVIAAGRPLTLLDAAKDVRQTKKGVSAKAYGQRQLYRGAFIATMASGKRGVFTRKVRGGVRVGRLPIRQLWGPSVPDALESEAVRAPLQEQLSEDADRNIKREIDRELRRQAGLNR